MLFELSATMLDIMKTASMVIVIAMLFKYVPLVFKQKSLPQGFAGGFAAPGWRKVGDKFRYCTVWVLFLIQ